MGTSQRTYLAHPPAVRVRDPLSLSRLAPRCAIAFSDSMIPSHDCDPQPSSGVAGASRQSTTWRYRGLSVGAGGGFGAASMNKPRVLVISRTFPNSQFPTLGVYTQRLVDASTDVATPTVISGVPYAPPLPGFATAKRFRAVERERAANGYRVLHPRILLGPGHFLHDFDARLAYGGIRRAVLEIGRESEFDVIHAHFIYPDGVMAARLGRELGVPVVVSEHSVWRQWFDRHPRVRSQVEHAFRDIVRLTAVSDSLRRDMQTVVGDRVPVDLLPNVVDDDTFVAGAGDEVDRNQLLFVGTIRRVKGLDVLVRAFASLAGRRPSLRLTVVGGAFYRAYARDERDVHALVTSLGIEDRVRFVGEQSPAEVAREMRRSAMLVVPSRRETFSLVAAEALASGIPVVATRCGGPEEFVTPDVGCLVAVDDVDALAAGIELVLDQHERFAPATLRHWAISQFGRAAAAQRLRELYAKAIGSAATH
jgi:glycosyltransferase involved in cell wall biosynthesis